MYYVYWTIDREYWWPCSMVAGSGKLPCHLHSISILFPNSILLPCFFHTFSMLFPWYFHLPYYFLIPSVTFPSLYKFLVRCFPLPYYFHVSSIRFLQYFKVFSDINTGNEFTCTVRWPQLSVLFYILPGMKKLPLPNILKMDTPMLRYSCFCAFCINVIWL